MADKVEVKKAVCFFCHCRCKVDVTVRNGRVVGQEEDKAHPMAGFLKPVVRGCPRTRAISEFAHHPDRLRFPLKRVGERGEGKWQQIPWEQAFNEISAKLDQVKEKYGAEAITATIGTGRTDEWPKVRFFNLLGSPNHSMGAGQICFVPAILTSVAMYGFADELPMPTPPTRCMMFWGMNPRQSFRHTWMMTQGQLQAGAKMIVVDPRRTETAERADIWLQLRPGTDCALAMGMINVIISENLYDKEFVDKWCYGFNKVADLARDYPPEKVAEITWVPADKIREAARLYATTKPGVIFHMMGIEHLTNCIDALQARYILTAITGNIDVFGGEGYNLGIFPGIRTEWELGLNNLLPSEQREKQIGAARYRLSSIDTLTMLNQRLKNNELLGSLAPSHAPSVYRAMITGEPYPVRACITVSSNPMVTQPNTKLVYKALKSLDLYVVHDYWMTPSAEIADYVTPAASWLERPQWLSAYDIKSVLFVGEPVMPARVEGEYDRKNDFEYWRGLGVRMGQEDYWPWETVEEVYNYRLQPLGYTLDQIRKEMSGTLMLPPEERKYERLGFRTPTGKIELYSTVMEELGLDPLPRYDEPVESPVSTPELAKEYPLVLITGARHMPYFHSEHRQIDSLRKQHPNPIIQIHPSTASELGINDGDWAWIETPRGRIKQICQYFEGIDPRVVSAQHGWWFPELPGEEPWLHGVWQSNINVVTDDDPDACSKKSGAWPLRALLCKVYKAKSY